MSFYSVMLALHNLTRWVVVILAILALFRAYRGWFMKLDYTPADRKTSLFFSIAADIQLLLGLILYFISPLTNIILSGNIAGAMSDPTMRFFSVEHTFYMFVAVVLIHVGSALARKATDPVAKHRRTAIWFTIAVLLVLVGIPWNRPLLRAP